MCSLEQVDLHRAGSFLSKGTSPLCFTQGSQRATADQFWRTIHFTELRNHSKQIQTF